MGIHFNTDKIKGASQIADHGSQNTKMETHISEKFFNYLGSINDISGP